MCCCNWSVIRGWWCFSMQYFSPLVQKTTPVTQNITATISDGGRSSSRQRTALFIDANPSIAIKKSKIFQYYLESLSKKATHRLWLRARASPTHSSLSILLSLSLGNRQPWCKKKKKKGAQFSALQALKKMTVHVVPPHTHTHDRTRLECTDDVIRGYSQQNHDIRRRSGHLTAM